MESEKWTIEEITGLAGKVFIVTGGNSGLGYETVKAFAMKGGEVVLASRSEERGVQARRKILKKVPGGKIRVMKLDLADLGSVRRFAGEFKKSFNRLNVLVNNAGRMWTSCFRTKDGFEGQFGTNHLGHFALTGLLMDVLLKTSGSRVVTVSSGSHASGKMDFENLQFEEEVSGQIAISRFQIIGQKPGKRRPAPDQGLGRSGSSGRGVLRSG